MGAMQFQLPAQLKADAIDELSHGYVLGGPDYMPWPTEIRREKGLVFVERSVQESGCLCVPWHVDGHGRLMICGATLIERRTPYHLQVELARGKVNQLRSQAADWQAGGLILSEAVAAELHQVNESFAHAVCQQQTPEQADKLAAQTIALAITAGQHLVRDYVEQVFRARQQRQPKLDTGLSIGVQGAVPSAERTKLLKQAFNTVRIPFSWADLEPEEDDHQWERTDAVVNWARANGFALDAGPLLDFSRGRLPDWLWLWEGDLQAIANAMGKYVEAVMKRYAKSIQHWQITASSNWGSILSLEEEDALWLTAKMLETARQAVADAEVSIGISQPWGEALGREARSYSPFVFADSLLRSDVTLNSLTLEMVMGVGGRGSYSRDLLDASRLLDLYALLGLPIRVILGCPSASQPDPRGDPSLPVLSGGPAKGWTADEQARWAADFTALAVCKLYVESVSWTHLADAEPHQFPHAGVLDEIGHPKPVMDSLRTIRESRLK